MSERFKRISILLVLSLWFVSETFANENTYNELAKKVADNKSYVFKIKNDVLNANTFGSVSVSDINNAISDQLRVKGQIQDLLNTKMTEDEMQEASSSMNRIITNYLLSVEPYLSLQLESLIFSGGRTPNNLPANFMDQVYEQWALSFPIKSFTYVFGSLRAVPPGVAVQFSDVSSIESAKFKVGPQKDVIWTRIIEVLSSKGPENTYMETTKCQLGVTIYAKYRRALEVLGDETSKVSIAWPSFCLGLKIDDLYDVAGVLNSKASDDNVTSYGFEDFRIRTELANGISTFAAALSRDEISRLTNAKAVNPFKGIPEKLINILPVLVAYPEGFIDLKDSPEVYAKTLFPLNRASAKAHIA